MRLQKRIIDMIKQSIFDSFGDVDIYLFGSRVDDSKKGGDIDIAVDTDISRTVFRKNKAKFISNLIRIGFDLKIDVVPYNTKDILLHRQIQQNSLKI